MLVDDVLLEIFDLLCRKLHYNLSHWKPRPTWDWLVLAHVCRRWRQIIFDSPRRLTLRILCTYGTPVRKNLGIWPAFPIDIQLDSPEDLTPKDEDNTIAALEHRGRVNSVDLFATGSQLGKMVSMMQEPFPVLTHLRMLSKDQDTPLLTTEFLGGFAPNLQAIILYRIPFPALPTLLSSTSELVTLNLFDLPMASYISPERMVACLATLPRLEVFAITFQDRTLRPDQIPLPPATRSVLPVLTKFLFQGAFEYLEDFVDRIDAPQLERVSIIYLHYPTDSDVMPLSDFIDRAIGPELTPSRHALVRFEFKRLTFTLSHDYETSQGWDRRSVTSTISFEVLDQSHVGDLAYALSQFSSALCTVVHLELEAEFNESADSDHAYDISWLHLLHQFLAMRTLHVSMELAGPVSRALEDFTADTVTVIMPSIGLICLEGEPASSLENILAIFQSSDPSITVVGTTDEFNTRVESYVTI